MCGRFSLKNSRDEVEAALGALIPDDFPPRYNIAPTQPILIVMPSETVRPVGSNRPDRAGHLVRWGFVPSWVKDPNARAPIFNIRSETAAEKNSFKAALSHRRVLVPASGFYEWRRNGSNRAQPYWIRPRHGGVIAFGALMETWSGADGSQIDTAGILTTGANEALSLIHHRMPVVVVPEDYARWMDCKHYLPREVADIMQPAPDDLFEAIPVSDLVNKVSNTSPDVQLPVSADLTATATRPKKAGKKTGADDDSGNGQLSMF
ncbi:SOS response-associated peptidase [Daeguia caeni]|uniref:Abasic site processing protein n=1 Tax=Daeguia caeni TaxID=439612 RepID=A0ABV9H2A3_9HYPH